jgi:hypothetical protein
MPQVDRCAAVFAALAYQQLHQLHLELEIENDFWRATILASVSCASGDDPV